MKWVKSSACENGACVEVAGCYGGECAEVAQTHDGLIAVRNSKVPSDVAYFTKAEWVAFTAGVRNGEFDY